MEVSIAAQTIVFLEAAVLGAALSVVYDLIRVLRVLLRAKRGKTALFDTLFCIISGISIFFFIVFLAKGEARGYIILGAILGAVLYFMTISRFILHFGFAVAKVLSKLCYPLRRSVKKAIRSMKSGARKASVKTKTLIKLKKRL